jgi:hypothetical protein
VDTLVTVPADPPAAGPDRALDPLPDVCPAKPPLGAEVLAAEDEDDDEDDDEDEDEDEDEAQPALTASTAHPSTPAAIRRLFRAGMISPSSQLSADGGDCRHRSRRPGEARCPARSQLIQRALRSRCGRLGGPWPTQRADRGHSGRGR